MESPCTDQIHCQGFFSLFLLWFNSKVKSFRLRYSSYSYQKLKNIKNPVGKIIILFQVLLVKATSSYVSWWSNKQTFRLFIKYNFYKCVQQGEYKGEKTVDEIPYVKASNTKHWSELREKSAFLNKFLDMAGTLLSKEGKKIKMDCTWNVYTTYR